MPAPKRAMFGSHEQPVMMVVRVLRQHQVEFTVEMALAELVRVLSPVAVDVATDSLFR